ncbi:MAG TPA: hypothetical protein VEJ43_01960, partial [Pseudolabrys sp.]|nr:hypothetical protein [Pseudolabrys sp.]
MLLGERKLDAPVDITPWSETGPWRRFRPVDREASFVSVPRALKRRAMTADSSKNERYNAGEAEAR